MRSIPCKRRVHIEIILGILAGALAILTGLWPDWIEGISGVNPDNDNGSFEGLIVAGLSLATVALAIAARVGYVQLRGDFDPQPRRGFRP